MLSNLCSHRALLLSLQASVVAVVVAARDAVEVVAEVVKCEQLYLMKFVCRDVLLHPLLLNEGSY